MKVGFIGLGRMGTPMAANLVAAGFDVAVWNRTASKADAFADRHGATAHTTPGALAATSDIVITMVADGPVLEAIYRDADGVLSGLRGGAVAVDMSTVGPGTIERLLPDVQATGAALVDAPVSGSTAAAEGAKLMIMAAGDSHAVDIATPALAAMGDPVVRVGPSGAGAALKLAINSMIYAINEAISEAMVLAEYAGIERAVALDAFTASAASSPMLTYRRSVYEDPDGAPTTFTVDLAAKDLRLALDMAARNGVPMPAAETNLAVMVAASDAGMGERDMGLTAEFLRRNSRADD